MLAVLLVLLILTSFLLSLPKVQTTLAHKLTDRINQKYDTHISINQVDLSNLKEVHLKEIKALDNHQDTMIYIGALQTGIQSVRDIYKGKPKFDHVSLQEVTFKLKTYEGETESAFDQFVEKLENKKKDEPSGFELDINRVDLNNAHFILFDYNKQTDAIEEFTDINARLNNFMIRGSNVNIKIRDLNTQDKRGLVYQKMDTDFAYTKTSMDFLNTYLQTKYSNITGDILMRYKEGDLSDFLNKVHIDATLPQADVSMRDAQKFYADFGTTDRLHLSTKMEGVLNDFTLQKLNLRTDEKAKAKGNFRLINAFDKENGFRLDAGIDYLETDYQHLSRLLPNTLAPKLPPIVQKLGHFSTSGNVKMNKNELDLLLTAQTDIGTFKTDILINYFQDKERARYNGVIETQQVDIGAITGDPLIGLLDAKSQVKGNGFSLETLDAEINAVISQHQYKGYTYTGINMQGGVKNQHFSGKMQVNDPNLIMTFSGLADLSQTRNVFDFEAKIDRAEFNKLNLLKRDSISILKGDIKVDMIGNSLETMNGTIGFKNATYTNQIQDYFFKDFNISSQVKDSIQTLKINSPDIINGQVKGKFLFKEFGKLSQNAIGSIYTNYEPFEVSSGQFLEFKFNIYNQVVNVFFPELTMGENTFIRGEINADDELFKLTFRSPEVIAMDNYIEKIRLQVDNKNPLFNTQLSVNQFKTKSYDISDFNLVNVTLNDTLFFRTEFKGGEKERDLYNLSFYHTIEDGNQSVVALQESDVTFNNTKWFIKPDEFNLNRILFNPFDKRITFDNFLMTSQGQSVSFYGSQQGKDFRDYNIDLDRVQLAEILPDIEKFDFDGLINGGIWIEKRNGMLIPKADVQVMDFMVNGELQGDLIGEIKGGNSNKEYLIDAYLEKGNEQKMTANGRLDFTTPDAMIHLVTNFRSFDISPLNALGKGVMENIRGKMSGEAGINGQLKNPVFSGILTLEDAGMYFPYINVDYEMADNSMIMLQDQSFVLDKVEIFDTMQNTQALVNGKISHSYFRKWNLDLLIETENLLALNKPESEYELFYGTGYLEGLAYFTGDTDNINISIIGSSNPGTHIIIPMSDLKTVETSRLIHFKMPETDEETQTDLKKLFAENVKGLTMNFDFEVNKNAIIKIVIDKATGSYIEGTGNGNILMDIDTKGTFNMYGDYVVDKGVYNFKYGGIINKPFTVNKGGTIAFNGDPYKAELDIEAVYEVKANPKALLPEYDSSRNIPVHLTTQITGELFNSSQEFDISVPNAGVDLASELDFVLNKEDSGNMMRQFVSLLTIGSFYNEELLANTGSTFGNEGIVSFATAVSNALMDVFSSPDDKIQFGFDYTIGNQSIENLYTDSQLGVSVSTKLGKNENFIINGEVLVPTGSQANSNVAGNVSIEFPPLNEKETLYLRVFNRQNDIQYSDEEEGYTQGLGLSWQVSFDSLNEFYEKLGIKRRKKKPKYSLNNIKEEQDSIETETIRP